MRRCSDAKAPLLTRRSGKKDIARVYYQLMVDLIVCLLPEKFNVLQFTLQLNSLKFVTHIAAGP